MGAECSGDRCETGSCESESSCGGGCPCGTSGCSGSPSDCATGMWTASFFQALKEAQTARLKARIEKAWGAKMDQAADAVLEAMGAQWQAMMAKEHAKANLQERLGELWKQK